MKKKYIFFSVSALIVIADQISKKFFEKFLLSLDTNSINVIGDELVRFTLAYNTGIAFSIKLGGRYFLSTISLIASIFIVYLIIKVDLKKKLELWAFTFILGGAIGNLIDRAMYGKVIDFIDCDFPDLIMTRWPIFNIADSFVTVGMVFLAVQYLFLEKKRDNPSNNQ
ncbi:MAG: signal peptidase II [Candidatus Delongbacteria bacterium]|nr:signal peptidase II [Candidatus Delongbacteria bacterium]